jgi:hypothetical protein
MNAESQSSVPGCGPNLKWKLTQPPNRTSNGRVSAARAALPLNRRLWAPDTLPHLGDAAAFVALYLARGGTYVPRRRASVRETEGGTDGNI